MPSSHPTLCPNGCYHFLNAPLLPLTENSGCNFRLPFHPHYCPNLGWLHHLFRGIIQQPNLPLLDLPPKYPCLLLQATCSQGHVMKLCHSQLIQSLATTFCSSSLLMPHSHNTSSLMSQNHLLPPPIQFLYPPMFSYAIKLLLPFPVWIPCLIIWTVSPVALLIPLGCFPSIIIVQQNLNVGYRLYLALLNPVLCQLYEEVKWSEVNSLSRVRLCDPTDCSLPGSSVHGIPQARVLEWVAISFSRRYYQPRDWTRVSRIGGRCFNLWATREASYMVLGKSWLSRLCPLQIHGLQS